MCSMVWIAPSGRAALRLNELSPIFCASRDKVWEVQNPDAENAGAS
jgi:hypothetical protein